MCRPLAGICKSIKQIKVKLCRRNGVEDEMSKVAILTDSNSGITPATAQQLGVYVLPMPFYINGELFYEEKTLTQEMFYERLKEKNVEITTSMPVVGDVLSTWDELLKEYEEVVYIPMSSGLSSSCETAAMLAEDYDGRVQVVNNRRISVTQRLSVEDARALADAGWKAAQIKDYLEKSGQDSTIYITLETLYYLKKGGRITPAAAALGTLLRLKPVLQIQGEKLDAYAKSRTKKAAKQLMEEAILKDCAERFHATEDYSNIDFCFSYSGTDRTEIEEWMQEMHQKFPNHRFLCDPLSLSISCHIGPGAIAMTASKRMDILR